MQFGDDFSDLLVALADQEVEFMVVGGWAMALHGHPRGTDDLDVWVRASARNAERVMQALLRFGAPVGAHQVDASLFARVGYGYRFGIKPQLIEVLTTIDGITFDEAWPRHLAIDIDGRKIPFIGRQDILANKRASGRPKDLADVAWLEAHPEKPD